MDPRKKTMLLVGVQVTAALGLMAAPFGQTPHLAEKLGMLFAGDLTRPIDIFDLALHGLLPLYLLVDAGIRLGRTPPGSGGPPRGPGPR